MPNHSRKLATIQVIKNIEKLSQADNLSVAEVLGWKVVVKNGEFKVGEKVVYFEVDSFLPLQDRYEFLRRNSYERNALLGEGYHLKTIRLRRQISQGLLLSLSAFPEYDLSTYEVGTDITSLLGIKLHVTKSDDIDIPNGFHPVIFKTDEVRIQSYPEMIELLKGEPYYISEKIDGMSITIVKEKDRDVELYSRNRKIFYDKNDIVWEYFIQNGIIDIMNKLEGDIAIQGELYGEKIQGNKMRIKGRQFKYFNVVNPKDGRVYDFSDAQSILKSFGLSNIFKSVKILEVASPFSYTLKELLDLAKGEYIPGVPREGIVVRPIYENELIKKLRNNGKWFEKRFSFKVINNHYLLRGK